MSSTNTGGNNSRSSTPRKTVIFCDFDGTITENDNIVAIMKHFDPPGWSDIVSRVLDRTVSIREGVGAMFALLPTSRKDEIVRYAIDNAVIRSGFAELLAFCKQHDIEFYVTSGGIDFFVFPLLAAFDIEPEHIYCNASDFSGETIRILWPHPCDEHCQVDCGMCKTTFIRKFPQDRYERILIGDSVTDFEGAKLADTIFARHYLIEKCEEIGLSYIPFHTFHDVTHALKKKLQNGGIAQNEPH
ncbi:2-hydroxy-3-keto-5-methylthiopentenyl-1-phosphate phosphatase [Paenibacillus koleovorans]|uniref:2-hydroxy-3-keto-5-methylthiopentenyl-1- phosphate phosphatase n=1 Tax=Paenibacillus koleovorans TaxID=121608 RepID=UPI000FD9D524|nr:2-hydroxy-3-keto-5-methylthiopentenyl-1-phosphate phosphatase [Paenibacillus koleovorans]